MSNPPLQPIHVRWLNLLNALRQMAPVNALTADESILLDDLLVRWEQSLRIKVSEIMRDHGRGAGVTVYRRLIALETKGLIELEADPSDKRVKFVLPTSQAKQYFENLRHGIESLIAVDQLV